MTRFTCDRKTDAFAAQVELPYFVALGETFEVEIADCFGRFPERDLPKWAGGANPITGPIAIEGVEPGDSVAVEIHDLQVMGDGFFGSDDDRTWMPIDQEAGRAVFPGDIPLPLNPHVGTIGVMPEEGSISTHDAGDHGGNMDCKLVGPGCVICFHANVPGAGLGLGDVHAVMGDGEVGGQGVETAAIATLSVSKVDGLSLHRPYGIQHQRLFVLGWGDTMTTAADTAHADMLSIVTELLAMPEALASKFLGMATELRVCWRGGNTPCMRMELPLRNLPGEAKVELLARLGRTTQ